MGRASTLLACDHGPLLGPSACDRPPSYGYSQEADTSDRTNVCFLHATLPSCVAHLLARWQPVPGSLLRRMIVVMTVQPNLQLERCRSYQHEPSLC